MFWGGPAMDWKKHFYRVGSHQFSEDELPADQDQFLIDSRRHIEPWLSAVFQAEHLNCLLGSGFTTAVVGLTGAKATGMGTVEFGTFDEKIEKHARASAKAMHRGDPNIEDQFRTAIALLEGLEIAESPEAAPLKAAMNAELLKFLNSLLETERGLSGSTDERARDKAENYLQSFLLSFASRAASRERLHIFSTNYDRLIEYGCDLAGLRLIDRFVGTLNPIFRSSRVEVDVHYNPPGIRGEPRFMEGVIRITKLHGSLDWTFNRTIRRIQRKGIPFGAESTHSDVPTDPLETVMIYPNPAKDIETTNYPYAELFRDFAAATCRPNSVVVTFGYGFGDDHINRVLLDMLAIPSTHLVVIAWKSDERLESFCSQTRSAQVSLLLGEHFANLEILVDHYLPKPALDYITSRMADLLRNRPPESAPQEKVDQLLEPMPAYLTELAKKGGA